MTINKEIPEKFYDFIFDWDYETYLVIGGYGSGKSYNIAEKIILECLAKQTLVLVVRETYKSIKESCFSLLKQNVKNMGLLSSSNSKKRDRYKVRVLKSPFEMIFPNGSRIIFSGCDDPDKLKSIQDVGIVWLEECSEIKYAVYKELQGRLRTPNRTMHFILSCNPVGRENWVYRHFFVSLDEEGKEKVMLNDEELYEQGALIDNGVYFHHSLPDDNPFLPIEYIKRLDKIKVYDPLLWRVARLGRFGPSGTRVLPQFTIAANLDEFERKVRAIPRTSHYHGMDFGFEESYNAVISMAVDLKESILYIYDEIYENKVTDDRFAQNPKMLKHKEKGNVISADNEDPKAITYYQQCGYRMRKCHKYKRLAQTRKIKRFHLIVCSPKCINVIRELKELTYKKAPNGDTIYDQFNIDPHTFSAIWYGLDNVTVADLKNEKSVLDLFMMR